MQTTTNSHRILPLLRRLDLSIDALRLQQDQKKRVGIFLGGYSTERHISVESGRNIYEKLASSEKYTPIPLFLTGNDQHFAFYEIPINILLKDNADDIKEKIAHFDTHPVVRQIQGELEEVTQQYGNTQALGAPKLLNFADLSRRVDAVFIALHGRPGEDGNLQQHLEEYGIPYNGSGVATSQITIDKYATNQQLRRAGIHVAAQRLVYKHEWQRNQRDLVGEIENQFTYPFIAKPSDDGCSSAVKRIDNWAQLLAYMNLMFRDEEDPLAWEEAAKELHLKQKEEFPQKDYFLVETLIEKGDAQHFLEVTGGLLTHRNNDGGIRYETFEPSETLASDAILSLEEKFLAGEGQNITPARYSADAEEQARISKLVQADLQRVAEVLKVEGYARIDAFVKIFANGRVETHVIEINSLPGMTPATCIFHQCALSGYTPYQFIDHILNYGMESQLK